MSTSSNIEWTEATWNPVTGCTRASAGCDRCYAVTMTRRLAAMGQQKYAGLVNPGKQHFNGVVKCHPDDLQLPLRRRKPTVYFVNSMSDLFHEGVPFEFIDRVFAVMALTPQHTYQVLTKRAPRLAEYLNQPDLLTRWGEARASLPYPFDVAAISGGPLPNVWLGTSVENQEQADARIPHLLAAPAAVRFLSCEPLLGAVDLTPYLRAEQWCLFCGWRGEHAAEEERCRECGEIAVMPGREQPICPECGPTFTDAVCPKCGEADGMRHKDIDTNEVPAGIDWVIVGGESGPKARPMLLTWARSLRDQCQAAGVSFFFKQWGEARCFAPTEAKPDGIGATTRTDWYNWPGGYVSVRLGKHAAGRLLDGRTWDEVPAGKEVADAHAR